MDPVTASILIGSIGVGLWQSSQQKKEQQKLKQEQERLRIENVYNEFGAQQQRTSTALGSAASRPGQQGSNQQNLSPSFASAALLGNQSSNTTMAPSSAGTF